MCITPSKIWHLKGPNWVKIPVPCKQCWRCRSNRVNDYVGRALCEAHTADWTKTITLTYRDRDDAATEIVYKHHFQDFIRALRIRKLKIRYLGVAEKGTMKGRVHFHAILFGYGQEPQISKREQKPWPNKKNFHIDEWPHGHVYVDGRAGESALRYACKYLLKEEDGDTWFTLSKKPPLGSEYFERRAQEYIENDIMPTGFHYMPPGGQIGRQYLMTGKTKDRFLRTIIAGLKDKNSKLLQRGRKGLFKTTFGTLSEWVHDAVERLQREDEVAKREAWLDDPIYQHFLKDLMEVQKSGKYSDVDDIQAVELLRRLHSLEKEKADGKRDAWGYET